MGTKEDAQDLEDRPSSQLWILQHLSEDVVRVAGEAIQAVYSR